MKKPTVICTAPPGEGLRFYLDVGDSRYFLFNQRYRSGVERYFGKGVNLNVAITDKATRDDCVKKIISKLPPYIRYIEKENGIAILNQTIKKQRMARV